ncbi:MAG TPA: arsenate reductase (glutaredoxin) [Orrella sp.]
MQTVTIYHNPKCSKSRQVLATIRDAGIEPDIIHYLDQPPQESTLRQLMQDIGLPIRDLLRQQEAQSLGVDLNDPALSDDHLIHLIREHPILLNRPIVVTTLGTKLCRPPETVLNILPNRNRDQAPRKGEQSGD